MINKKDFIKSGLIKYNLFILNHKSDNNKVNNIDYNLDYVRLK